MAGETQDVCFLSAPHRLFQFGLPYFRQDGDGLATLGADGEMRLWDVTTGYETLHLKSSPGHSLAFSADGASVIVGSTDGSARVWHSISRSAFDLR